MNNWRELLIRENLELIEAMKIIDRTGRRFVIVVDDQDRILGTLTDGNIRRALIHGKPLLTRARDAMTESPVTTSVVKSRSEMIEFMRTKKVQFLPVVNETNRVIDIILFEELLLPAERPNPVVLMAGGMGARMGSITQDVPKPMLRLGERPILQIIIENFRDQGFRNFMISVNYKAEMIEDHFRDGSEYKVQINYLREKKRLGTAGSLSLLTEPGVYPLVVMNGDILSQINFQQVLDYFEDGNFDALMCVRKHDIQVPYGVVHTNGKYISEIDEKPVHSFFINAGIYVLSPKVIEMIPSDTYMDMTHLFEDICERQMTAGIFPIFGYWQDLGSRSDLQNVRQLFGRRTKNEE